MVSSNTTPEELLAYASAQEDMLLGSLPEEHRWVLVEEFPVSLCGPAASWRRFWREENEVHPGVWGEGLIEAVASGALDDQPLVIALAGETGKASVNVWDVNHRLAAAIIAGRRHLPVVVGVSLDMSDTLIPARLRASLSTPPNHSILRP